MAKETENISSCKRETFETELSFLINFNYFFKKINKFSFYKTINRKKKMQTTRTLKKSHTPISTPMRTALRQFKLCKVKEVFTWREDSTSK